MKNKAYGFELEPGDTHPDDFEYGKEFIAIVHGRKLPRTYNVIYCASCGKQIKAKYMKAMGKDCHKYHKNSQYRLQGQSAFNQAVNCTNLCRYDGLKLSSLGNQNSAKKKVRPFSEQVPTWTAAQIRSVSAFINDPASKIIRG